MPAEPIRVHVDPLCPWCWVTVRWLRRLDELGVVALGWGLFSLQAAGADDVRALPGHDGPAPALRTMRLAGERHGRGAVGRLYVALGEAVHDRGEPVADRRVVAGALQRAGLEPGLLDEATADERVWQRVLDEHLEAVGRAGAFGVPTVVLDDGDGPAIFGPVISEVPDDADAVALWEHVAWLTRHETFYELKRRRSAEPDLESVRRMRSAGGGG